MNLENIYHISLIFSASIFAVILIILFFKAKKVISKKKDIEKKIEESESELTEKINEKLSCKNPIYILSGLDSDLGLQDEEYHYTYQIQIIRQKIDKLKRDKGYLLEDFSIYKIFKK